MEGANHRATPHLFQEKRYKAFAIHTFEHLIEWRQIYIQVLLVSAVTSVILGLVLIYKNVRIHNLEQQRNEKEIHDIAKILTPIVQNLDLISTHAIGKSLLARSYVREVTIAGNSDYQLFHDQSSASIAGGATTTIQIPLIYSQNGHDSRKTGELLVLIDTYETRAAYWAAIQAAFGLFVLIAVLGIIAAVIHANRYIINPLKQYSEMVESYLQSNRPVRVEENERGYIGRYQTQFSTLQNRIFLAQSELQHKTLNLERREHLINSVLFTVKQTVRLYEDDAYIDYNNLLDDFSLPEFPPLTTDAFERHMINFNVDELSWTASSSSGSNQSSSIFYEFQFKTSKSNWFNAKLVELSQKCVALIFTDITESREAERTLLQSQKMEVVGSLTSGIAHDFNNVLAIIYGNLELILLHSNKEQKVEGYAQTALRASQRASSVVTSLLSFSKRTPEKITVVTVSEIMQEVVSIAASTLADNISLSYELQTDATIRIDVASLETALINLVINARDAMQNGGNIRLMTRDLNEFEAIECRVNASDYIVLDVCDEGSGLRPEYFKRITESFFTTKVNGTGLGLSMVEGVVEQAGGKIFFSNNPTGGATFSILLPCIDADSQPQALSYSRAAIETVTSVNRTIVVIEDNLDLLEVVVETLNAYDLHCIPCASIAQARSLVQTSNVIPAVIITDLNLGDGIAMDLHSDDFHNWRNIPKIVMSGNMEHAGGIADTRLFSASLLKPVSSSDLVRAINSSVRHVRATSVAP